MDREQQKLERKKRLELQKKKRRRSALIVLSAIVLMVFVIAYLVPNILSAKRSNISDYESGYSFDNPAVDPAFLFSVDTGEIRNINHISGGGCLSTTNSLISFKKDGSIIDVTKTGYSAPVTKSSGKYCISFERSTGKFSVTDKKGLVFSDQLDGEIVNADIASNGNYLIVSRKSLTSLLVTVYSDKQGVLFQWECNESYITDCAISSGGRNFAVASFDVVSGEQKSQVLFFSIKSVGVDKTVETGSDIIYDLKFLNNDSLGIFTDKCYLIAATSGDDIKKCDYEYDTVSGFTFGENDNAAVLKASFGSLDENEISVFDRNANEIFRQAVSENVIDFCFDKSFVYVMTSCKISVYSIASGELFKEIETAGGLRQISVFSGKIICASESGVYKYSR